MSYVYDTRPDCVLQQLINIIYANEDILCNLWDKLLG